MKLFHVSMIPAALLSVAAFGVQAADAQTSLPTATPIPAATPTRAPAAQSPATREDAARDLEPAVNTSTPTAAPTPTAKPSSQPAAAPTSTAPVTAPRETAKPPAGGTRNARVMDRLNLDATQVTGNSELPKVLYIVPWKRADLGDLNGRPMNSLLDEVLSPIDRDVFRRENRYYNALEAGQPASPNQGTRDEK